MTTIMIHKQCWLSLKIRKVEGCIWLLWETHRRAVERHLRYGITRYNLLLDTGKRMLMCFFSHIFPFNVILILYRTLRFIQINRKRIFGWLFSSRWRFAN